MDMRNYLFGLLQPFYHVKTAINGVEGLQLLQKEKVDMVISDIMMPHLDGIKLRKKMMALPLVQSVPYVFLSAKSLDDHILEGLRLGVDDYITKPFNSEELLARVHNLLSNHSTRLESYLPNDSEHQFENVDFRFVKQMEQEVLKNLNNPNYKVEELARTSRLSQKQLSRRLKNACGMTAIEFMLEIRMLKARQLINRNIYNNLTDIRIEIGIESASYFSRKFKERFGASPSALLSK